MSGEERWGTVELEPEIEAWLTALSPGRFGQAAFDIDLLEERGALLAEPYTRQLRGKLREMRFYVGGEPTRLTYFVAKGRRIILLTVFPKRSRRERAEIDRAERAMLRCVAEGHTAEDSE